MELLGILDGVVLTEDDDRIWWLGDKKVVNQHWIMPNSLITLLHAWKPKGLPKKGKMLWRFLPAAIYWGIWKARNGVAFEGKEVKVEGLINDIKVQVFFWIDYRI
ncbi:hypothetical protein BVC80_8729g5 [Macleaya cordata]|uniref:Reverse transcriptase zinc-binding domain n=1 Tax=Macleaya cordata TaxID=56857 RepID=A0A200Q8C2_MACCD|nr:hypothetical protein BVC80_8729g5 [Macleaya cordata]